MLDPFGISTFAEVTRYWTVAEKNTQLIPRRATADEPADLVGGGDRRFRR